MENKKPPVKKFKAGAISCSIWENEAMVTGHKVRMLKATIERRYTDQKGNWQSSGSFGRNEIPMVRLCLQRAFEYMVDEGNAQGSEREHISDDSGDEETVM